MGPLRWLSLLPIPAVAVAIGVARAPDEGSGARLAVSMPRADAVTHAHDSLQAERDSLMASVLAAIRGREQEPAESVFANIKVLRGMPAGRVPRIMNQGYSRALGVSCSHCHVVGEWDRDDHEEKGIARQMVRMTARINEELLKSVEGLPDDATINCTTCHRGATEPALNLPPTP